MHLPLREELLPRLRIAFHEFREGRDVEDDVLAIFPAAHPEVGDLLIQCDSDEVTVFIGSRTHKHFGNYDVKLSAAGKATKISEDVISFLEGIFANEIEFYGSGGSGGSREINAKSRGFVSRALFGKESYVWSGPVREDAA